MLRGWIDLSEGDGQEMPKAKFLYGPEGESVGIGNLRSSVTLPMLRRWIDLSEGDGQEMPKAKFLWQACRRVSATRPAAN